MNVSTAFYSSPIGILKVDASADFISSILFVKTINGEDINESALTIKPTENPLIQKCIDQLQQYFEGNLQVFYLFLQQSGTIFQQKVWEQLRLIPYGRTISYQQLSVQINNVKAIRAVGTANGSNHLSIVVPCHRIIGSNGSLVGYSGDLWRKKWLLDHENKWKNGVQKLF